MKLISLSLNKMGDFKLLLLLFFFIFPMLPLSAEGPKEIPGALKLLQERVSQIKSFKDVFEALDEFVDMKPQPGTLYNYKTSVNKVLTRAEPVVVDTLSELCDEAIYDFRQSLKVEFIQKVGASDGKMRRSEFIALVNSGKFPTNQGADEYFTKHDKDNDGKLTLNEYTPSSVEIARTTNAQKISDSYINGEPYSTGQEPTQEPPSRPVRRLYATPKIMEARIRLYASNNGLETRIRPDGKLGVAVPGGGFVPIPPFVFPPKRIEAEQILRVFAANENATLKRGPNFIYIVKRKTGTIIPIGDWPPRSRPPYFPPPK